MYRSRLELQKSGKVLYFQRNYGFWECGSASLPRYQSYDFLRQATVFFDFVRLAVAVQATGANCVAIGFVGLLIVQQTGQLHLDAAPVLSLVTAGLSNLVSSVPAVLVLKPFVANLQDPTRAWLLVAMASALVGNLTLVGSVANLIVAQRARRHDITFGLWAYFKEGTCRQR
ncbi:hypothetical protein [Bradyrhizobium sp. LMG 9283]|uniref:hypothetical protein n=1 Tax=Bradyrhizobium sp. LMG 9283 TaxID=592064 RepID=UPI00388FDCBD